MEIALPNLVVTLHYPKGAKGIPIYTSSNPKLLYLFKRVILEEWLLRERTAGDEVEALIARAEYDRLKRLLDFFIPTGEDNGQTGKN